MYCKNVTGTANLQRQSGKKKYLENLPYSFERFCCSWNMYLQLELDVNEKKKKKHFHSSDVKTNKEENKEEGTLL